nr:unnamed protein product [Digitaria exilis]
MRGFHAQEWFRPSSGPSRHDPDPCIRSWYPTTGYPVKVAPSLNASSEPWAWSWSCSCLSRTKSNVRRSRVKPASLFPSPGVDTSTRSSCRSSTVPCPGSQNMSANSWLRPHVAMSSGRSASEWLRRMVTLRLNCGSSWRVTCEMTPSTPTETLAASRSGSPARSSRTMACPGAGVTIRIPTTCHCHILVGRAALAPEGAPVCAGGDDPADGEPRSANPAAATAARRSRSTIPLSTVICFLA